jgi:hypothetical protein
MSPMAKYSLARLGLFLAAATVMFLLPVELNPFLRLGIALVASALLSYFLLRNLRDLVAEQLAAVSRQRADRKERLRSALAGDEPRKGGGGEGEPSIIHLDDEPEIAPAGPETKMEKHGDA